MLSLQFSGNEVIKMPNTQQYLKFHTPKKSGDREWKIIDEETGKIVDSYTPSRRTRQKPCTSYEGSWADTVSKE